MMAGNSLERSHFTLNYLERNGMGGGTPLGSKNKNQFSVHLKSLFRSDETV